MTLDDFVKTTAQRLPTAQELMAVADALGLSFGLNGEGKPVVKFKAQDRALGGLLARLLRREPWRTQVVQAKGLVAKVEPSQESSRPMECRWRSGHEIAHDTPECGWPHGAGWFRFVGDQEWRPIPGREVARGEAEGPGQFSETLRENLRRWSSYSPAFDGESHPSPPDVPS